MAQIPVKRTIHIPMRPHIYYCRDKGSDAYPTDTNVWHDEHTIWDKEIDGDLPNSLKDMYNWTNFAIKALENAVIERATERFGLDSKPSLCIEVLMQKEEVDEETVKGISSDVLANIEVILRKIKENADDIDYVQELNNELDRILSRNDLTREDIKDLL